MDTDNITLVLSPADWCRLQMALRLAVSSADERYKATQERLFRDESDSLTRIWLEVCMARTLYNRQQAEGNAG